MPELGSILADASLPLFERYRAMFSLRNIGGQDAVQELCNVLVKDDSSALLRHEVAYVLGQMQHPSSVEALAQSLRRPEEHKMVRHESAEALGAIDGRWDAVEPILNEFSNDENDVVRESCLVALDAADYWSHVKGEKDHDGDENDLDVSGEEPSFAKQKADNMKPVLQNHFNVVN
uniref:Deoxyhypusine monooxygenase n=1 Tax=Entomoneis paludosa TaxID=265537 RepID=A0A7S3DU88_9STRA